MVAERAFLSGCVGNQLDFQGEARSKCVGYNGGPLFTQLGWIFHFLCSCKASSCGAPSLMRATSIASTVEVFKFRHGCGQSGLLGPATSVHASFEVRVVGLQMLKHHSPVLCPPKEGTFGLLNGPMNFAVMTEEDQAAGDLIDQVGFVDT